MPKPPPEWITIKEAADRKQVSVKTIRRWISGGLIYAERVGPRLIRIDARSLANMGRALQYREEDQ